MRGVGYRLINSIDHLTPLPVAGCGRLQLGVAHWATSGALLQVVYN